MEKELVEGKLGAVGSYDVKYDSGKLIAEAKASPAAGVSVGSSIELDSGLVLDAIGKAHPGMVAGLCALLKSALGA